MAKGIGFDEAEENPVSQLTIMGGGGSTAAVNGLSTTVPIPNLTGQGSGDLTDVEITTANGFAGSNDGLSPVQTITLTTDVTGLLYGDGTAMSAATIGGNLDLTLDVLDTVDSPTFVDLTLTGTSLSAGAADATFLSVTSTLIGNASSATYATNMVVADAAGDTTTFPMLSTDATGTLGAKTDADLTYNATTNNLSSTLFTGSLVGNASSSTSASNMVVSTIGADTTAHVLLSSEATGTLDAKTDPEIIYNATTGHVTTKVILSAGGAGAGTAPFQFTDGVYETVPRVGAMEFDNAYGGGLAFVNNTTMGRENVITYREYTTSSTTGIGGSNVYANIYQQQLPFFVIGSNVTHEYELDIFWSHGVAVPTTVTIKLELSATVASSAWDDRLTHSPVGGRVTTPTICVVNATNACTIVDLYASGTPTIKEFSIAPTSAISTKYHANIKGIIITNTNAVTMTPQIKTDAGYAGGVNIDGQSKWKVRVSQYIA